MLTVVPMLLMIAGGIALAQAVSDPAQVTLRWLRLGGLVALGLLTVTGLVVVRTGSVWQAVGVGLITVPFVVQLLTVQMGHRRTQRIAAVCGVLLVVVVLAVLGTGSMGTRLAAQEELSILLVTAVAVTAPLSAGLMGGFIMTMLLGHAYLTAGNEMTQAPFRRLVRMLGILLALRMGASIVFGLWPYFGPLTHDVGLGTSHLWNTVMITARYGVGLLVPAILTFMIRDCVRRRANQSATGILYVAGVLVILGEGLALGLQSDTGWIF